MATDGSILALDIGARRIGLALANIKARLAAPAGTVLNDESTLDHLHKLCASEKVHQLVVGLPRGLDGQETAQTMTVRAYGDMLHVVLGLPIAWQDEALTSVKAEAELDARHKAYKKGDVDALAAVYILEDYIREHAL